MHPTPKSPEGQLYLRGYYLGLRWGVVFGSLFGLASALLLSPLVLVLLLNV